MNSPATEKSPLLKSPRVRFFGCALSLMNLPETVDVIRGIISRREPVQHCVINANKINLMEKDEKLRAVVQQCGLVQADGVSVVWAGRLMGLGTIPRVTGIDLMNHLIHLAHDHHYRVYFLGAEEVVLRQVLGRIKREFTGVIIAGAHHGYFPPGDNEKIVADIFSSKADILLVAIPSPQKEYWLSDNMGRLNVPFCMGVGGSFDVFSGKTKRAPQWVQKIGFEWCYRMIQEPVRLGPRYAFQNILFLKNMLLYLLRSPSNDGP